MKMSHLVAIVLVSVIYFQDGSALPSDVHIHLHMGDSEGDGNDNMGNSVEPGVDYSDNNNNSESGSVLIGQPK